MLYARATERSGETALRLSLGATRGRLLRQELVETTLLAGLAAAFGLVLALGASALLARVMPTFELNRYMQIALDLSPDHRVLFIALAAGLASALLVGGLTAWHASRMVPLDVLAASSVNQGVTRRTGRTRLVLVSLQVTVAVLVALATGLLWEQVAQDFERQNVRNYHVNYDSESVVTGRIDVRLHGYEEAAGQHFFAQALDAVRAVPGVDRVALADALPGARESGPRYTMFEQFSIEPPSGPARRQPSHFVRVSPGFFDAIGLGLREGRDFLASDVAGAQAVAIVSASFARSLWPDEPAMGRQFTFAGELRPVTIVGVAEDPVGSADTSPLQVSHMVFLPLGQPGPGRSEEALRRGWSRNFEPSLLIVARSMTPAAVYDPIRAALRRINDDVAVQNLSSARDSLLAWLAPLRALTILMTSAGTFALSISMLGVYGVVSYFVSLRRRELAIRLALGASPRQVLALVLAHTRKTVLIGLLPGVWIGASGSRWIETTRFDLMPNEIRTWVAVPLLILIAGLAAGYVPARRASKIDPNVALRSL
jgi:predicted permease